MREREREIDMKEMERQNGTDAILLQRENQRNEREKCGRQRDKVGDS